jgi:hypothetical protein
VTEIGPDGGLQLRDVSTARLREKQREEIEQTEAANAGAKSLVREEAIDAVKVKRRGEVGAETRRLLVEGDVVRLTPKMTKERRKAIRDPRILADEIAVERAFVAAVDKDPGLVAGALTESLKCCRSISG